MTPSALDYARAALRVLWPALGGCAAVLRCCARWVRDDAHAAALRRERPRLRVVGGGLC